MEGTGTYPCLVEGCDRSFVSVHARAVHLARGHGRSKKATGDPAPKPRPASTVTPAVTAKIEASDLAAVPGPADRLLSRVEVAAYLNVPAKTLAVWASKDQGPRYLRIGRHTRYRRADVDSWADGQAVTLGLHREPARDRPW